MKKICLISGLFLGFIFSQIIFGNIYSLSSIWFSRQISRWQYHQLLVLSHPDLYARQNAIASATARFLIKARIVNRSEHELRYPEDAQYVELKTPNGSLKFSTKQVLENKTLFKTILPDDMMQKIEKV